MLTPHQQQQLMLQQQQVRWRTVQGPRWAASVGLLFCLPLSLSYVMCCTSHAWAGCSAWSGLVLRRAAAAQGRAAATVKAGREGGTRSAYHRREGRGREGGRQAVQRQADRGEASKARRVCALRACHGPPMCGRERERAVQTTRQVRPRLGHVQCRHRQVVHASKHHDTDTEQAKRQRALAFLHWLVKPSASPTFTTKRRMVTGMSEACKQEQQDAQYMQQ